MTHKQRLLAAIRGEPVDKTPWSPFLAYWWEGHPEIARDRPQWRVMLEMGGDPMLRGFGSAWRLEQTGVDRSERTVGHVRQVSLNTPVGALCEQYTYSPAADSWFLTGHPLKTAEDYKILTWINEHSRIIHDDTQLARDLAATGEDALIIPIIGSQYKTCFQSLVEHWVGTVELCYMLEDNPRVVEECLAAMRAVAIKTVECSAASPAEVFIFWEDSSTTNISPAMFEKYTAPEIRAWGDMLHGAGKLLVHHACGHLKGLLPMIGQLPIDALESASPPPTGNIALEAIREALPDHIALIGGIEPVFFENCTMAQLKARTQDLLRSQHGTRFVLANSDSCPPGVSYQKLCAVAGFRDSM